MKDPGREAEADRTGARQGRTGSSSARQIFTKTAPFQRLRDEQSTRRKCLLPWVVHFGGDGFEKRPKISQKTNVGKSHADGKQMKPLRAASGDWHQIGRPNATPGSRLRKGTASGRVLRKRRAPCSRRGFLGRVLGREARRGAGGHCGRLS